MHAIRLHEFGPATNLVLDDLPDLVKRYGVEEVLIADAGINPGKMFEVLMECGRDHHIKYRSDCDGTDAGLERRGPETSLREGEGAGSGR